MTNARAIVFAAHGSVLGCIASCGAERGEVRKEGRELPSRVRLREGPIGVFWVNTGPAYHVLWCTAWPRFLAACIQNHQAYCLPTLPWDPFWRQQWSAGIPMVSAI